MLPQKPKLYKLTDVGNGERLADRHRYHLRYVPNWKRWLAWDGKRWDASENSSLIADRLAVETVCNMYREAADFDDKSVRKALVKHARKSEADSRITAMLRRARSQPGVAINPVELNRNDYELNCDNGILNLKTGQLQKHAPDKLHTQLCPLPFDPDAGCPTWEKFLSEVFAHAPELVGFTQRWLGYCLTGSVEEQRLPIFFGTGANGKSTLIETILSMLGDYGLKAPPDLLMAKPGTHPTERADLYQKRFVACVESGEGRRVNEQLVKELTGGDRQRVRRLYENYWSFDPTHKLVLCTNHRPSVRGRDHGIWRRLLLVPFEVVIPDASQDKKLPEKLKAELPGILAWCVRGCLSWQQEGLRPPQSIRSATSDYKDSEDVIGQFVEERCVVGPDKKIKASEFVKAQNEWAKDNGERAVTQKDAKAWINENKHRGFRRKKSGPIWYCGLELE